MSASQKALSSMIEARSYSEVMASDQVEVHGKAHLVLNRNPGAGAWVTSHPNSPDTHLPAHLFTVSHQRRLRMAIWDEDSICPLRGQAQDRTLTRATESVVMWCDSCSQAPVKDKPGLLPPRDPDDGGSPPPAPAPAVRPRVCGASVMALSKAQWFLRRIAVWESVRRLTSKVAVDLITDRARTTLEPLQSE